MPRLTKMDEIRYKNYNLVREKEFEAVCTKCGSCCGALDDPCSNLARKEDGTYWCQVYPTRLGPQRTVSGESFTCVPISRHIAGETLRFECAYQK